MLPFLLWSAATVAAWAISRWAYRRTRSAIFHPVLCGLAMLMLTVELTGHRHVEYHAAAGWIGWVLGPALVALAVPVYRLRALLAARLPLILVVLVSGMTFGAVVNSTTLRLAGMPREVVLAGPLQSLTSPAAVAVAEQTGARVDATLAGVLTAGMAGAAFGPRLLRRLGVHDRRARGLAMGCCSHVNGVSSALEVDAVCGAFATLAMAGNAMLGALLHPLLARWLGG